ncbi:hypothetical protein V9T40_005976 [Parthenolecanium corni]|uniref:F-box domain-containing protein n=1 Tax=Parthenolecanium corni TaxID=536013 RepID=A0AAN9YBH2_9HEMI
MSSGDSENRELSYLPAEIWNKVFTFLPLDDRKSVRQSCHRFYEACNNIYLQKNEEIVFYGDINTNATTIHSLSSSKRKVWNVKLYKVRLGETCILEFFQKQGINIHSLEFNCCEPAPGIFDNIIKFCVNLHKLILIFRPPITEEYCKHLLDDFQLLKNNCIVRDSVKKFALKIPKVSSGSNNFYLKNCDFLCFFDIFPNISDLNLTFQIDRDFDFYNEDLVTPSLDLNSNISFASVRDQLLKMRQQLEKLHLHFTYYDRRFSYGLSIQTLHKIAGIEMEQLKELSLNWFELRDHTLINPFLNLRNLTHLDCTLNSSDSPSAFVQLLLNTATGLQTLTVRTISTFFMNRECFQTLVSSRLITLNFYPANVNQSDHDGIIDTFSNSVDYANISEDFFWIRSLLPNHTLKNLNMSTNNRHLLLLFCTYFQSVDTLILKDIEENILLRIFQVQTKFRTLVLCNCNEGPRYSSRSVDSTCLNQWLESSELSWNRHLNDLTHLHIVEHEICSLSEFMLTKFVFPKLKSLKIEVFSDRLQTRNKSQRVSSNLEKIWMIIKTKYTQLESLEIRCRDTTTFQQWLALLSALPKLRQFVISARRSALFSDAQYEYCIRTHPSLRLLCVLKPVSLGMRFRGNVYFFRDIITNSIEKRSITNITFHITVEREVYPLSFLKVVYEDVANRGI